MFKTAIGTRYIVNRFSFKRNYHCNYHSDYATTIPTTQLPFVVHVADDERLPLSALQQFHCRQVQRFF